MPKASVHEEVCEKLPRVERENIAANWIKREIFQEKNRERHAAHFESREYKMLKNKYGNIRYQQVFNDRREE